MCTKILIIGNGFDLANGLPTTYSDFLNFCKYASYIFEEENLDVFNCEYAKKYLDKWAYCSFLKTILNDAFNSKTYNSDNRIITDDDNLNQLYSLINENVWYRYFQYAFNNNIMCGNNWIDLESEISLRIRELDEYYQQILQSSAKSSYPTIVVQYMQIHCLSSDKTLSRPCNEMEISKINDTLLIDLNRITHALEIYMSHYISQIAIHTLIPDFKDNRFSHILSFNYTDTFSRHYHDYFESDYDVCYVHGKAVLDATTETCNLVLGIDEYLIEEQRSVHLEYLSYKKFYQRIIKQTDNSYSKWLDDIMEERTDGLGRVDEFELHIYGHSLDVTDKDILQAFILNPNVQTKIYYYRKPGNDNDKTDFSSKIRNLIKIIGPDELIARTSGGSKNTIEFIAQKMT